MLDSISSYLTPTGDLVLKEKQLTTLPKSITEISNSIIQLDLRNNSLTYLSSVISSLTHLRSLDLRFNTLETLPDELSCLIHLKILRIDNNNLTSLPSQLFSLTSLTILTVNRNCLQFIPPQIGNLKNLLSLIVSSNQLKSLPSELGLLRKVKVLYVHGNEFVQLPSSLCRMRQLCELSLEWFRYSVPPLPRVLKNKIGEAIIESLRDLCQAAMNRGRESVELVEFVRHFSEEPFEGNRVDLRGRTALHIAVLSGDNGVIQGLINAGHQINAIDADGFSPFVLALKENNIRAAVILMDAGADVNMGGGCFGTPLNLAVLKSEPKLVARLLEAGISPNSVDFRGNTCLLSLLEVFDKHKHRNKIIADLLLKHGAVIIKENLEKWSAVHLASKEKQHFALKWMHKKNKALGLSNAQGFNFNAHGGAHGWTPLHIASHSGDYNTVETLIGVGANPCIKNYDGKTAKETSRGNLALFKYLTRIEKQGFLMRQNNEIEIKTEGNCKEFIKVCEEYKLVYDAFAYKDREEIEELVECCQNQVVKADAIYLVGQFKQKKSSKMLYKAKKIKDTIVKSEVINAMHCLKNFEHSLTQSLSSVKLPRHMTPQSSLPNLLEFVEEDTRVDTLLLM